MQVTKPIEIPISSQTLSGNISRIAISYVGWLTIYFVVGGISTVLIPKVRTLKPKEQMFWNLAMARAVCGTLTGWAFYLAFIDKQLDVEHTLATTDGSWTFVCVILGFFIFEEVTLIYFDLKFHTFSKELHMHHFFAFIGYFTAAYYNCGHYYAAKAFILEASTPFSCMCWCLLKLRLERTTVWKVNQWILIYIFHTRTFLEFLWWRDIYLDWDSIKENLPIIYTINMLVGLVIVSFWLTPYWTYKKTVQFFYPSDWNTGKQKAEDDIDKTS